MSNTIPAFFAAAVAAFSCGQGWAQTQTPYQDAVVTGIGFDSYRNQHTQNSCVVFELYKETGRTTDVSYREVDDANSLMNSFKMSVGAKASFITGGGSADVSFTKSSRLSTTGTNISVHVLTLYGAEYVVPRGTARSLKAKTANANEDAPKHPTDAFLRVGSIHLTPQARYWAKHDLTRFRTECGDSYISGTMRGSGLDGVAVAETKSDEEHQAFAAAITGSYGPLSGHANMQTAVDKMATENRVLITYVQYGGAGAQTSTDVPGFRQLVENVGSAADPAVGDPPKRIMEYRPYTELGDYRAAVASAGDMGLIVDQYLRLLTLTRWAANDVITAPDGYALNKTITVSKVAAMATRAGNDMEVLKATLQACSGQNCTFPAGMPKTDYDYRAMLPLTTAQAAPWASAQDLIQKLADVNKSISTTSPTVNQWVCDVPSIPFVSCPGNIGHYRAVPNPVYQSLLGSRSNLQINFRRKARYTTTQSSGSVCLSGLPTHVGVKTYCRMTGV